MSNEIKMFEHKQVGFGEELLKDHFVEARFTNSDRTWIEVITNEVFKWDPSRDDFDFSGKSYVLEKIMVKINYSQDEMRRELRTRKRVLDWMVLNDIRKSDQVSQIITEYYVRPEQVLARVDGLV